MAQLMLYLFGTPRVARNGDSIELNLRKGLALLAYLAVTRQPQSRDTLATLLWPENDQQAARSNLRRTIYELAQRLGTQLFDATAETIALPADAPLRLDTEHFQKELAEFLPAELASHPTNTLAVERLVAAAGLYTADFMAGFTLPDCPEFDDWQFFQREALRRDFANLVQHLVFMYEAQEKWEEAIRYARRWLALDTLDENVHRRLMQLYAYAGQVGAALRQYEECVRILKEELSVSPEAETALLHEMIRTRRFPTIDKAANGSDKSTTTATTKAEEAIASSPFPSIALSPSNPLPAQTTPFVGRRQELAQLLRQLREPGCRLLTLVGPGGIGKTRLVIEAIQAIRDHPAGDTNSAAEKLSPHFKDGSFFIPLQPVNAPSGIIPAIAGALGMQFYSGTLAQQQVLQFLREKEMLLTLDNFEHLLSGAEIVAEILAGAPGVKVLVTSREALKLHEEWFHPLAGMRLPPMARRLPGQREGEGESQEEIAGYDAVQLFVQTARRAQGAFDPATEMQAIVHICQLVDGMPLGIELAASWLRVLSCTEIANEIKGGIDILVTRHQNVPARHRSMRAVLEHSWQLLGEEARSVLSRLAVFRGGFLQSAAGIAGADLLTLADLVDKSWIYRTPNGRYQIHELLRQYADAHLIEAAHEESEMKDRHAAFYLGQVAGTEARLTGPGQRKALDQIDAEIDNVEVAWMRAVSQGAFDLIDRALQALYLFFHTRSRYLEGEELFSYALHQCESRIEERGEADRDPRLVTLSHRLLVRLSNFHLYQGNLAVASRSLTSVLDQSHDTRELALAHATIGNIERLLGNRAAADVALHSSLRLAREVDDLNQMVDSLRVLSDISSSWADFEEGKQFAEEALQLCRKLQRPDLTGQVLAALAWVTNCLGGYADSERYYRESLEIAEEIASPYGIALATNFLGWVAFCAGGDRLPEAMLLYSQAMAIWRQIGQRLNLAMCLGDYALAANEHGDYAVAMRFAQEGLALAVELEYIELISYNSYCLGTALCGLGDLAASQRSLNRALQIASKAQIPDTVCAVLYFVAQLRIREGTSPHLSPTDQWKKQGEALELLTLLIQHRATWQLFRDRALPVQAELVAILPADIAAAAIERGRRRTMAEVVAEIDKDADDHGYKDDQVIGK